MSSAFAAVIQNAVRDSEKQPRVAIEQNADRVVVLLLYRASNSSSLGAVCPEDTSSCDAALTRRPATAGNHSRRSGPPELTRPHVIPDVSSYAAGKEHPGKLNAKYIGS
jgi:hypothetical protein